MASARFLEEALRTDVDESTVNAIVGSLETHLVTSTAHSVQQQQHPGNSRVPKCLPQSSTTPIPHNNNGNTSTTNINHGDELVEIPNGGSGRSAVGGAPPVPSSAASSNVSYPSPHHGAVSGEVLAKPSVATTSAPTPPLSSVAPINLQLQPRNISVNEPKAVLFNQTISSHNNNTTHLIINGTSSSVNNNHPSAVNQVFGGVPSPISALPTSKLGPENNNNNQHHLINNNNTSSTPFAIAAGTTIIQTGSTAGQTNAARSSTMSKNNEPVKLVYPSQQQQQSGANTGAGPHLQQQHQQQQLQPQQQSQSAVINMNNRVTFTSQTLPNGTINLTNPQHQAMLQQHQTSTAMNVVSSGGAPVMKSSGQPQQQQSHLVIQKQGNQNMVQSSMMPGVQILNMRPGAPVNQQAQQQKTVAAVSPRVVTHMVGARPANAGQQQQITLTTLQNLQQTGQTGQAGQQAILLKTESGQFQLLRVGPSPVGPGGQPNTMTSSANQTIRLQTVPAQQTIASSSSPSMAVNSVSHAQPIQHIQPPQQNQMQQQQPQQQQQTQQPIQQQQQHPPPVASVAPVVVANNNYAPANQNTKEKCRKFLANLLELSSREPRPVEQNVRKLIQELIDANVEPEVFCERLEKLLNASPQPCLIGFLKKSLPLLRQSLVTKELVIEGIKPPPHNVAFAGTISANIPAQLRPVGQSPGPAQMRMVGQAQPRPIGQTTITRHTAPVRIQGPNPRLVNATVRPGASTIVQNNNIHHQMNPPTLQPVGSNMTGFTPGGAQIRPPRTPAGLQIRQAVSKQTNQQSQHQQFHSQSTNHTGKPTIASMKVGSTQIKHIPSATNGPSSHPTPPSNNNTISVPITSAQQPAVTAPSVTTPITAAASSTAPPNVPSTAATTTSSGPPTTTTTTSKSSSKSASSSSATSAAAAKAAAAAKEKEKKTTTAAVAASAFYPQSTALSMASSMYGDDDINDVAAMGGVNLAEESQRILGSTELIGTQIRSCKDEIFLHMPALQAKIRQMMAKHGLDEPTNDVAVLISHATQERLKNIVEKLAVIAEHRIDIIKVDPRYEVTKDVRGQIKFLEELDKAEQKRHEEQEREMLMRAAKSRSKTEDPEQAKLKAKAKEMQRAEMEELRQRDANLTALQAIGPRKKPKLEGDTTTTSTTGGTGSSTMGAPPAPLRPRIKRVNLKDMVFHMEQERETCRSTMLYKAYLK